MKIQTTQKENSGAPFSEEGTSPHWADINTGMMKILELREKGRAVMGAKFDIRGFHARILSSGPLPLPILEDTIDAWIERAGAG